MAITASEARKNLFPLIEQVNDEHTLSGTWSRRITEEHRLVYLVDGDELVILQARSYYQQPG